MPSQNISDIWKTIKGELEIVANPTHFKTYVPTAYIKSIDESDKIIEITCANEHQRNFLEDRLYGHLKDICKKVIGPEYRLMFSITEREPKKLEAKDLGPLFDDDSPQSGETELTVHKIKDAGLYDQYTLDNYIIGTGSRLAYAVATAIIDSPGKVYNPFFLHSGVGLGKTHLVQAIGHEILRRDPNKKVLYKTGEQFLNEVVDAVSKGKGGASDAKRTALKRKYRNVDVLIVDDVHAIAGKPATQDEFFHTFNALFMAKKQIILTSDRAPHEIRTLEERLSSRFASGMIADIQAPDVETRMAILKFRSKELGLVVPDDVIAFVATEVSSNIRELQAKLLQITTQARSAQENLTKEFAAKALGLLSQADERRITPNKIIREVAKFYGITVKDLKGKRRLKPYVIPRQVSMFLLREMSQIGYQSIGELLGNRDHTTILHGVSKIEKIQVSEDIFKKELEKIKENILIG